MQTAIFANIQVSK